MKYLKSFSIFEKYFSGEWVNNNPENYLVKLSKIKSLLNKLIAELDYNDINIRNIEDETGFTIYKIIYPDKFEKEINKLIKNLDINSNISTEIELEHIKYPYIYINYKKFKRENINIFSILNSKILLKLITLYPSFLKNYMIAAPFDKKLLKDNNISFYEVDNDYYLSDNIILNNEYEELINIQSMIKKINWKDLKIEKLESHISSTKSFRFVFYLPDNIQHEIEKYNLKYKKDIPTYINIYLKNDKFNSINLSDLSTDKFKNLGLGYKCYKKLIDEIGFIKTNKNTTNTNSRKIWYYLITDKELFSVELKDKTNKNFGFIVISKNLDIDELIKLSLKIKKIYANSVFDNELLNIIKNNI